MLQHNVERAGKNAHFAHALVVGMHALCCGLPIAGMLLAGVLGAASGVAVASGVLGDAHRVLHAHEIWVLALSAVLVTGGGALERAARRSRQGPVFSVFFMVSVVCFAANLALFLAHRGT